MIVIEWKLSSATKRGSSFGAEEKWKSCGHFDFSNAQGRELVDQGIIEAIKKNKGNQGNGTLDILLATFGHGNKAVVDANAGLEAFETGIGYSSTFARFRVYESYAWLHVLNGDTKVNHYHKVIPNCYYPSDFEGAQPSVQGRYLVFASRIIEGKGIYTIRGVLRFTKVLRFVKPSFTLYFHYTKFGTKSCFHRPSLLSTLSSYPSLYIPSGAS
jgi:hypothetical protein